jgi:hypothetical protein
MTLQPGSATGTSTGAAALMTKWFKRRALEFRISLKAARLQEHRRKWR